MTHEERLQIAQKLAQEIRQQYRDALVAIAGSTAKGEDDEHSDLEMWIVTTDELPVEEKLFFYRGVLVDLYRCPQKEALAEARKVTPYWPVEADALRSYLVLYECGDFLARLKQAVADLNDEDFAAAICKLMLQTCERLGKLKNAWERDDLYSKAVGEHAGVR
jgi:kanamycin nucleotidyltransferase